MVLKKMMSELIEEEITQIEQNGEKVRLKTLLKIRVLYTLICGVIFALFLVFNNLFLAFVALVVYFVLLYFKDNVSVVTKLAQKSPDTPISEIIKGDMK